MNNEIEIKYTTLYDPVQINKHVGVIYDVDIEKYQYDEVTVNIFEDEIKFTPYIGELNTSVEKEIRSTARILQRIVFKYTNE